MDGISFWFIKCEAETEEQKPWAGKKSVFCGATVFSLTGESRKQGCNKMRLIEKAAEMSWRVHCAHLRAVRHCGKERSGSAQGLVR